MRLTVQTQVTLDMFQADADAGMAWMTEFSPDMGAYITDLMDGVDTIVLGRKLAQGFIPHWATHPADEPDESIDFMNNSRRLVLTRTLTEPPWPNVQLVGSLDELAECKASSSGDLIAYGGGQLLPGLLNAGLVDDLNLFVHPVAIGTGMPVFGPSPKACQFTMRSTTTFENGVTALRLAPARR